MSWENSKDFFDYVKKAIQGREYGKFIFTKNVSEILETLALKGEELGLSREELSYISIDNFLYLKNDSLIDNPLNFLKKAYEDGYSKNVLSNS